MATPPERDPVVVNRLKQWSLLIGGIVRSVALLDIDWEEGKVARKAGDHQDLGPYRLAASGDKGTVGSNLGHVLLSFQYNGSAILEEDGVFGLHQLVSKFIPGSVSRESYPNSTFGPHMPIITYTVFVVLAILRDEFTRLDRPGLVTFLRSSQREDGSEKGSTLDPTGGDTDLRLTYRAFVICTVLNNWSGVNVEKALEFVRRRRTYQGGYGSARCEAQGRPIYLAIAILRLAPDSPEYLRESEKRQTLR
ncbi:terpenoid cyclases/Protein prenyltransferase [Thelephora ganbajun]|uniref:Terpenoid cyclases/Protein prenyltransferase n=1 Tax=Thelephora ganbajun TaxID=370292 RepID=A0ACB6ZKK2_THEGA|nr:terpenoid cyclases/Protein prenyltransferase [Thelephora ganbajun]